jgi:hypothetical protein
MDDGVEILVPPGWQINQSDFAINGLGMPLAAINGDGMPARD